MLCIFPDLYDMKKRVGCVTGFSRRHLPVFFRNIILSHVYGLDERRREGGDVGRRLVDVGEAVEAASGPAKGQQHEPLA